MSETYTDLSYTTFPNAVDNIPYKNNIQNSTEASVVNNIQLALLAGDMNRANSLIRQNPEILNSLFNANDFNKLRDSITALERFFSKDIQGYLDSKQVEWKNEIDKFTYKGVYSNSTQYQQNNMVSYTSPSGTLLYICIKTPPTGTLPTNTYYWNDVTKQGERGVTGDGFSFTYLWSPTQTYKKNDVVVFLDKWWVATSPNTNQTPVEGSPNWESILTSLPPREIPVSRVQPINQTVGDLWYKEI